MYDPDPVSPIETYRSRAIRGWRWARPVALGRLVVAVALGLMIVPWIDLWAAGLFYDPSGPADGNQFWLGDDPVADALHEAIQLLSRLLAVALLAGLIAAIVRLRPCLGLGVRQWAFLALALALGPGLVANVVFKNGWDRARPKQVEEFGGTARFTPPFVIADQCETNCSFVSGDSSIMFYLHSFAYIVRRRRKTVFFVGLAAGLFGGFLRMAMGAHFLSDVLFSGLFMVAVSAAVHTLLFGPEATRHWWRTHIFGQLPVPSAARPS